MWRNAAARFVNLSRRFDKIDFPSKFAISSWEPARYIFYVDFSNNLFKFFLAINVWPRRSVHEQGEERVPEQRLNLKLSNLLITLLINDFTRIFNELQNIYFVFGYFLFPKHIRKTHQESMIMFIKEKELDAFHLFTAVSTQSLDQRNLSGNIRSGDISKRPNFQIWKLPPRFPNAVTAHFAAAGADFQSSLNRNS